MTAFRFPNESDEYRARRDALLEAEVALRAQTEKVAEARRALPLGGRLKEDYAFTQMNGEHEKSVPFADLFGPHDTLLLYSLMFGAQWDAPCPSCTSIVDGIDANALAVQETASVAVVAAASARQLHGFAERRGWEINLVSGQGNDYLLDYCGYPETTDPALVSIMNVFQKTPEGIFHFWGSELVQRVMDTGSPRHVDPVWPLWNLLDMTPEGRGDSLVPKQNFEHTYFNDNVLPPPDGE